MRFFFTCLLAIFLVQALPAQGHTPFVANYNHEAGNATPSGGFSQLIPLPDGGFMALGGYYEKVLARLDENMSIVWAKTFSGTGGMTGSAFDDFTMTNDGYVILLGRQFGSSQRTFLAKVDINGTVIFQKKFYTTSPTCFYSLYASSIIPAYDNGFLILGATSDGNAAMFRMDENGNALWAYQIEDAIDIQTTVLRDGVQAGNNEYMLVSNMRTASLLRIDDSGNLLSSHQYETGILSAFPTHIRRSNNGDIVVAGSAADTISNLRWSWMMRTDPNGNLSWLKRYDCGSMLEMVPQEGMTIAPSGELLLLGYLRDLTTNGRHAQFSRFDQFGTPINTVLGSTAGYETCTSALYRNGGFYLAGYSSADRNLLAYVELDGTGFCNSANTALQPTNLTSSTNLMADSINLYPMHLYVDSTDWTVSTATYAKTTACGTTIVGAEAPLSESWRIAPQPSAGDCWLHHPLVQVGNVSVFDLSGREVWSGSLQTGGTVTKLPLTALPKGVYVLLGQADGQLHSQRLVLQ